MKINDMFNITVRCVLLWSGIVAAAYGATPLFAADDCKSIHNELKQLRGLIQRKKFIEKALQKCQDDPVINYFHAYNLDRRGKPREALKYYRISIVQDENNSWAFLGMGDSFLSLGQTKNAIEAYEHGLLIDPNNKQIVKRLKTTSDKYNGIGKTLPPEQVTTGSAMAVQPVSEQSAPEQVKNEPAHLVEMKTDHTDQAINDAPEPTTEPPATVDAADKEKTVLEPTVIAKPVAAVQDTQPDPKQIGIDEPLVVPLDLIPTTSLKDTNGDQPTEADLASVPLMESPTLPGNAEKQQQKQTDYYPMQEEDIAELTTTTTEDLTIITGFASDILALIQFKTGEHKLDEDTIQFIKINICKSINDEKKSVHFEVVGHTDDLGTLAVNQKLSLKRAGAISKLIAEECDISSKRLHVDAYGKSQPMTPNITPENREENRRVEIKRIQNI